MKKVKSILKFVNIIIYACVLVIGMVSIFNSAIDENFLKTIFNAQPWTIAIAGFLGYYCSEIAIKTITEDKLTFRDYKSQYDGDSDERS